MTGRAVKAESMAGVKYHITLGLPYFETSGARPRLKRCSKKLLLCSHNAVNMTSRVVNNESRYSRTLVSSFDKIHGNLPL